MKILVIDYAREDGGGNTISNFINNEILDDNKNQWLFITAKYSVSTNNLIFNLQIPWIKKSLLHRFLFEKYSLKTIIDHYKPDLIFSLQNFQIKHKSIKKLTYLHQALPFSEKTYLKNKKLKHKAKFYLMKLMLQNNIKNNDYIIVQTNYMMNLLEGKTKAKIIQNYPQIFKTAGEQHQKTFNFIYPTNAEEYKRLDLILLISRILKRNSMNSEIYVTLNGEENIYVSNIHKTIIEESLSVKFIGRQTQKQMEDLYRNNHLVFTSEIESLGLPIIEAMHFGCNIFALNTEFSKELTASYSNTVLFTEDTIEYSLKRFLKLPDTNTGRNIKHNSLLTLLKKENIIE